MPHSSQVQDTGHHKRLLNVPGHGTDLPKRAEYFLSPVLILCTAGPEHIIALKSGTSIISGK